MSKAKILIQLDGDSHASVFDSVVAVDAGVEHLLQYHDVHPRQVRDLVHGAMFTRGPEDLRNTAVFIGGSNVSLGEALLKEAVACFFGPMRVSVMLDANGANTTAAAAVLAAAKHADLSQATATVLAATGPVGQRAVRLLARLGTEVRVASRSLQRAESICRDIAENVPDAKLTPVSTSSDQETEQAVNGSQVVIAAGAAGVELLPAEVRTGCSDLQVAIDLNAVPPAGIGGIEVTDKAVEYDGVICYGAIGVGGSKMKIHKAAIAKLFETNDLVLDAEEIFALGNQLDFALGNQLDL